MNLSKRIKKYMIIIGGIIVLIVISLLLILVFLSPGKPKQFIDDNGKPLKNSISEKIFLEINGAEQGMFLKGENLDNPIILYLHGGMPDYFFTEKFPTKLEKNFTVIWWEQRNCGISPNSNNSHSAVDQLVDDAIDLTKYLLKRFDKKKIYLMGHSGGTFIGINVIDKAPELYYAYIGIAQISDQLESEKLAYEYMLSKYRELGNEKMLESLQRIPFKKNGELSEEYAGIRDAAMHELGIGTMKETRNLFTDIFLPSLLFSEYTLSEKYNLWTGKKNSGISQNWNSIIKTNLMEKKFSFQIPIYFFHGITDYTCSYVLAKKYFNKINAPVKGFYTFAASAHSPIFEEPKKMNEILVNDVLNLRIELADNIH
jgi:pimeloyl-ACP methyl ester carboxylesterase